MKIRRRFKRSTRQYMIVALICIVVIGGAATLTSLVITNHIREEYKTILKSAYEEMEANKKSVYIAKAEINAGDFITLENVEKSTVYASQPETSYMTFEDLGKLSVVDIPLGIQVLKSMLTPNLVTSEVRELEYNVIHLNSNILSNDTVDVRIYYPNGESYIVLSKKKIRGIIPEVATCFFWLEEEEILRMSAAIVDASLYPGSRLLTTKYIEPNIQKESVITYTPSLSILSLIETDPNIVERCSQELNKEVRKSLENRLAASMATDVSKVEWDVSSNRFFGTGLVSVPVLTPTPLPVPSSDNEIMEIDQPNGSDDYLFYAEEEKAKEGIVEYGE